MNNEWIESRREVDQQTTLHFVGHGTDHGVNFSRRFPNVESAREYAARFPKSLKARAYRCTGSDIDLKPVDYGCILIRAQVKPDGVVGSANEAGQRRIRRFLQIIEQDYFWDSKMCTNSWSKDQFEAWLNS